MRWKFLAIFLILAIALAVQTEAAVIYGGKLFHGQNFTTDVGITYRIYGLNPYTYFDNDTEIKEERYKKIAIVGDPDGSVYVFNNSCESSYLYKYCFIEHYLDLDNPLTFQDGNILSMISISVETLPPPTTLIDITRNMTMETYCGQLITIPLSVYNEGAVATNFTYKETFPPNTFVTLAEGGTINSNEVSFKQRIQPNETINYTFTITNFDCEPKNWTAEYSFTTYNDTIYRNITDISISVLTAYNITDSLSPNKTNYPSNKSYYVLNFTNIHPTIPLHLNLEITAPGLTATDSSNGISTDGKVYRYNNF
ncbi:MAG TPA: hypothetical protein VEC16_07275, partial [Alphaproteobacteria bacterium]|nr:hypothetical protein [Alphaproteobacteria bacterium]